MKIFLLTSTRSNQSCKGILTTIAQECENRKHIILNDYLAGHSETAAGIEQQVKLMTRDLMAADVCIFEASTPSLGIGHLIGMAWQSFKPCIIFYTGDSVPEFLTALVSDRVQVICYRQDTLKKSLIDALNYVSAKIDVRFNVLLSPELMNYLTQAAKKEHLSKSDLVRQLLYKHQEENS